MTRRIEPDPNGEKLNSAINNARARKVKVREIQAKIFVVTHEGLDDSNAMMLEARLISLGFEHLQHEGANSDDKTSWIRSGKEVASE